MNDAGKRGMTDNESDKRTIRRIDQVSRISAIVSIVLLAFVITSTVAPHLVTLPIPPILSWYGLAFSFLLWFSTRKGGCGSCNQQC